MAAHMPDGTMRSAAATPLGASEAFVIAVGGMVDARSYFTLVPYELTGNERYKRLMNVQCTLDFSETTFEVSINLLNRTIKVVDDAEHHALEKNRALVKSAIEALSKLSSAVMGSTWINLMGDAFIINVANVDAFEYDNERATLRGVEMVIESMVDSVLESISAAQFKTLNNRQIIDAAVLYKCVRVGDWSFIYAVLVITVIVVLVTMVELFATRLWRGTPAFDFTRIVHVAVAASADGTSLAESKMSGQEDDGCRVSLVIPDSRSPIGRLEDVWQ
jgi:hypothetical protein